MVSEMISLESFLHTAHRTSGICSIIERNRSCAFSRKANLNGAISEKEVSKPERIRNISVPTFDSILLLKIAKRI